MIYLSIIIPAYNEEKRIRTSLTKLHSYFNSRDYRYEVILVDDGSTDRTREEAFNSTLYSVGKLKLLQNMKNRGKGFSLKKGILTSKGDYILLCDADLSTPIEELEKLICFVTGGFDIAIGSRGLRDSDVKIHQPFYREYMGKFFNRLVRVLAFNGIKDTQCGFKLLKANLAKNIALSLKIDHFSFDVEMLYIALQRGYKIKEVSVLWRHSPESKVNPIRDSLRMMIDLFLIKRLHGKDRAK